MEDIRVALARIEERQIAMNEKLEDHLDMNSNSHAEFRRDLASLKGSRNYARGGFAVLAAIIAFLGFDEFF